MTAPPHEELALRAMPQAEQATTVRITDQLSYEAASHLLLGIQALLKEAEDFFREPKSKAAQAHQSICAAERKITDPLTKARDTLKNKMATYKAWEQEQAELANRKAREQAAAEHALDVEIQLEEAESRGASLQEIRAIMTQPSSLPQPAAKPVASVRGISVREDWFAEITDLPAFLQAALADKTLLSVIDINQSKLNQLARLMKGTLQDVPGLRMIHRPAISASRQGGIYR